MAKPPTTAARQAESPVRAVRKRATAKAAPKTAKRAPAPAEPPEVASLLGELQRTASSQFRADMSARYGIVTKDPAFGTPMAQIKQIAKPLGRDHALAEALWKTGVYEARMLASLVDEPEAVTPAQMNRWAKDFDNWALVDTLCFNLFDRSPHAFAQVTSWSKSKDEFVKRAAFALLASLALHGQGTDQEFLRALPLIERASGDARNFVKKGVSWALRAIGLQKSPKLRAEALALAQRLATSDEPAARWTGKDALREFAKKA
jgi:3-methyladenine DNA glycosylase AlkD